MFKRIAAGSSRDGVHTASWLFALVAFLVGGVMTAFLLVQRMQEQAAPECDARFDVHSFLHARRINDYQQPDPELVERISAIYSPSDGEDSAIPGNARGMDIIVIDDIPYYSYWQGESGKYTFHPMALGLFLESLNCYESIENYIVAAIKMAHELPNGGLLWYYPDKYYLNRFLGPDLSPSAISQGQILGAITSLDKRCQIDLAYIARRVFLGLAFDYYAGGVNLENQALLEIPLFRSAPEIILNGWLHALLNLCKYVEHYRDPEAEELLRSNLLFLGKVLSNFHDEKTGLSRYSDLSPYRIRVHHGASNPPRLTAFYKAKHEGWDDLAFDLTVIAYETQSPYDNQIIRQTRSFTDIWISCSQNYETYLVSDKPVTVTFNTGEYSPYRSMPGTGGEEIRLVSSEVNGLHIVNITSVRDKLFCGYPTNFSKMGENYYHTYHVVALACLLVSVDLPNQTRMNLRTWMERWITTIETFSDSCELRFSSYEKILRDLVEHEVFTLTDDWYTLLKMARETCQ